MSIAINIDTWNKCRELTFCPKHFVMATTPLTAESKLWVLEKLHGRFFIANTINPVLFEDDFNNIYFEDPQEAVFYELKWS